ncbi:Gfo/Idh/MocA family oxidoreductase [Telmatocola sphagniphila]|uniref:Gfo/Idh/MocA family oxidoreductase n=1 Tax=Telmatocola sphagniphila TaxID=1123043 RepID=A0A8E6B306_9BACT|nr:Gfo/Idh/MocA family oxidoreductase [Telmatocola sphagniphila]QVL30927.1 Gfo/Idh/MocA family oxidoreductase [Telmatocola sphagniphila]
MDRRAFVLTSASALALSATSYGKILGANDRLQLGIMGMGGRGNEMAPVWAKLNNVEIAYFADPDKDRLTAAGAKFEKATKKPVPKLAKDFRSFLDDKNVDAMFCSAPNHWHAPGAIAALNAGKHVYVEKPCSHNGQEGEWLVTAAEKHKKLVQMGNQRRSFEKIQEAIKLIHEGELGRVYLAQCWYQNSRGATGTGMAKDPPAALDYDLWQGPATRKPFRSNYLHYTWHWFWHWGNGELGNNGIHMIDVCRWGLQAEYPIQVTSTGGRYRFQDDQETPDTNLVTIVYPDRKSIVWEGLSCNRFPEGKTPDVLFHGEKGSLSISGGGYRIYDEKGKEKKKVDGSADITPHVQNFVDAVRGSAKLNSPITEGHKSTLVCHLGNIAYRLGRLVNVDSETGRPVDEEAAKLWGKQYEKGWEPKV